MENLAKLALAAAGAVSSYLFGGWSSMLEFLLMAAAVDYVTGFAAAANRGQLSSSVGLLGIAKKIFMFAIVAIAHQVDQALGNNHMIRDASLWWYLANELVSIVENAGQIGVPIPPQIAKAIAALQSDPPKVEKAMAALREEQKKTSE